MINYNRLKKFALLFFSLLLTFLASCGESGGAAVSVETTPADLVSPIISGDNIKVFQDTEVDFKSFVNVTDDTDQNPVLDVDASKVDMSVLGVYPIVYTAKDSSGNVSELTLNVTVMPKDITPPFVAGEDFSITEGDSISYKKQITVSDDFDDDPVIEVDNTAVDIETPGVYPVIYTVTDASGNKTVLELEITVNKKIIPPSVSEEYVLFEAENILETIIKKEDSDLQKLYSIYRWCKNNIGYSGESDKTDWIIGAYEGFVNRKGDCYTYYAVSKALVTAAGFENFDVVKLRKETDPNRHYWLLINLDGGYYHFDTTRFRFDNSNFCMLTDEEIWAWDDEYYPGTHTYDNTGLPAVSTVSVQDRINYNYDRLVD